MDRLRALDTPRRLCAVAGLAFVLVIGHTLLALRPAKVEFINLARARVGYAQTETVLRQIDDKFYLLGPDGTRRLSATGQLNHHVSILTQGCDELGSLDVAAGEGVGVTLNADRSVTVGTGMIEAGSAIPAPLAKPPCPVAIPLEIVLRDIVLALAMAVGALGLALLLRKRASARNAQPGGTMTDR